MGYGREMHEEAMIDTWVRQGQEAMRQVAMEGAWKGGTHTDKSGKDHNIFTMDASHLANVVSFFDKLHFDTSPLKSALNMRQATQND